jgi:periplasmic copper chaperone A
MNIKFPAFVALFLGSTFLQAQTEIENLRVVAPIPGQDISAAYLLLKNDASSPVDLISVESENAEAIQIHTHQMNNGMMRMVQLETLPVEAGGQAEFKRGGLHLMVFSPDRQALDSGVLSMTFHFSDGSSVQAEAAVEQLMPASGSMNHQDHQHH